jgi:hypothetical protein
MNKIKNIIGLKFEKLTVLKKSEKKGNRGELYWDCICDCGQEKTISGDNLKSLKVKSCGCLKHEKKINSCDLIGQKFGRLIVINEGKQIKKGRPRWDCKCECGNIVNIDAGDLKSGKIKSCKCLQKELASSRRKMNQLGENNSCYNPLLTDEDRISRRHVKGYKEWSFAIKKKFNFTCEICKDNKGGNLISHHLYSYMKFKEFRLNIENGVCLCESCHNEFHNKFGWGNNTKEQFISWQVNRQLSFHTYYVIEN